MIILSVIIVYFTLLLVLSRFTARRTSNDVFFRGERKSPWYMVAFGMIGASISGVTFVSVPGMVMAQGMTYLQMCLGFVIGYFLVAFVLLPVYYRHNLTTIYSYLGERLGARSHLTGTWFFLLSKFVGAAIRFYVVCMLLQHFVLASFGIPFYVTVPVMVLLIWLYTRRSGIKTLVWTDTFQTTCMFLSLILIIIAVISQINTPIGNIFNAILSSNSTLPHTEDNALTRMFVFDDWTSKQNFFKQFFSGIFITIVMTGLDQDMMQKNLTCRTLHDAQKDMCSYGFAFVPANFLFLLLGVLLVILANQQGMTLPEKGDDLLPMFAATGQLGTTVMALFTLGIVASSFSSADSALTALTTSFCVDVCHRKNDETFRRSVHIAMAMLFAGAIIAFDAIGSSSVIDLVYTVCGYTYGPLLGLFAYSIFTRRGVRDTIVPYICIASPVACYILDQLMQHVYGYKFGYELLMLNGLLVFTGCWATGNKHTRYY